MGKIKRMDLDLIRCLTITFVISVHGLSYVGFYELSNPSIILSICHLICTIVIICVSLFFDLWIKEILADTTVAPKEETAKGINYSINQEEYLKVFLTDGEVPIDNSATKRALRGFTIGRKN